MNVCGESSFLLARSLRTTTGIPGGQWTLASIHTEAQNLVVKGFAEADGDGRIWIGLSDVANEGSFVWDDGTSRVREA